MNYVEQYHSLTHNSFTLRQLSIHQLRKTCFGSTYNYGAEQVIRPCFGIIPMYETGMFNSSISFNCISQTHLLSTLINCKIIVRLQAYNRVDWNHIPMHGRAIRIFFRADAVKE